MGEVPGFLSIIGTFISLDKLQWALEGVVHRVVLKDTMLSLTGSLTALSSPHYSYHTPDWGSGRALNKNTTESKGGVTLTSQGCKLQQGMLVYQ